MSSRERANEFFDAGFSLNNEGYDLENGGNYRGAAQKYNAAIEMLTESLTLLKTTGELKSEDTRIYISLGFAHRGLEKYDKAIGNYSDAIRLDPQCNKALHNLANTYTHDLKQYDEAIPLYSVLVSRNPKVARVYFDLACCYTNLIGNKIEEMRPLPSSASEKIRCRRLLDELQMLKLLILELSNYKKETDLDPKEGSYHEIREHRLPTIELQSEGWEIYKKYINAAKRVDTAIVALEGMMDVNLSPDQYITLSMEILSNNPNPFRQTASALKGSNTIRDLDIILDSVEKTLGKFAPIIK
jgi:hypothetical protein